MREYLSKVDFLAQILYEVIERRVSLDVAFKRVCRGRCAKTLTEREELYLACRRMVSEYVKLMCSVKGRSPSYRTLVRMWINATFTPPNEPHCQLSVSKWLYERLTALMSNEEVNALFREFNERAWWLRLNRLKASEERILRELEAEGVDLEVHPEIPYMVRVTRSPKPIRQLKPVKELTAIPMDIASAISVEFLGLERGEVVVDMCAAPGLKTSLVAMLGEDVKIVALDISKRRVKVMKHLLRRMGVPEHRVEIVLSDSRCLNLARSADKVLLDAPCSNSGSIDKDPSIKATITPGKVEYYSKLQLELLSKAAELSGTVVYTTCSLLPDEGEEVVKKVLEGAHMRPVMPVKFRHFCRPGYSLYSFSTEVCRLFPHIHRSEGFFIARLEKRE